MENVAEGVGDEWRELAAERVYWTLLQIDGDLDADCAVHVGQVDASAPTRKGTAGVT